MQKGFVYALAMGILLASARESLAGLYPHCAGYPGICGTKQTADQCIRTYESSTASNKKRYYKGWQCIWDPSTSLIIPCKSSKSQHNKEYRCNG